MLPDISIKVSVEIDMYIKETCIIKGIKEIDKYKRMRKYVKGEKRGKKINETSVAQKRINERLAKKNKQRIIRANFEKGDLFITFTYQKSKRPKTKKTITKDRKDLIDRIRKALQKQGIEFKYVCVTEIGVKGAVHHHILIKSCDTSVFSKAWSKGSTHIQYIYSEDLERLAAYMTGDKIDDEDKTKHECVFEGWSRSRNLIVPEVKRERISAKSFSKIPRPEKGTRIVDLRQGVNAYGYEYQSYKLVPDERPERKKLEKIRENERKNNG